MSELSPMQTFGVNAGTALASAAIGQGFGDSAGSQYRWWRKKMQRTDRMQRDTWKWMNQQALQLRVQDGRAAGLSPLASIGAAGAQMPALASGGISPDSGSRYADILNKAILESHRATTRKTDSEARYIQLMSDLAIDNHMKRNRITSHNPATKAANSEKPDATIAADTTIDDWEPGDIQLLSEEMSQSFESLTSTLATAAINAGLYAGAAYDWFKEKYPHVKDTVLRRAQKLVDEYFESDELPAAKTSRRIRKPREIKGSTSQFQSRKHYLKRR